jgi:hypothetical protein
MGALVCSEANDHRWTRGGAGLCCRVNSPRWVCAKLVTLFLQDGDLTCNRQDRQAITSFKNGTCSVRPSGSKLGADRLQTHAAAAPDRLIPPGPHVSRGLVPPRNSSAAGLITFGSISFNSPPSRGYYLLFHTAQLHFFHDALLHFFHDALLHFSIPRRSRWPLSGFVVLRSLAC